MIQLPQVTVTASRQTILLPIHDPSLCTALVLQNESAYNLNVQFSGGQKTIAAWTADVIPSNGTMSSLDITPTLNLPSIQQPNNILTINLYGPNDLQPNPAQYPMPLQRAIQNYAQAINLGTVAVPNATGAWSGSITLQPSVQALLLTWQSGVGHVRINTIQVTGGTTSGRYFVGPASPGIVVLLAAGVEATVTISGTSTSDTAGQSITVLGLPYAWSSLMQATLQATGQTAMANSQSVSIASDQSPVFADPYIYAPNGIAAAVTSPTIHTATMAAAIANGATSNWIGAPGVGVSLVLLSCTWGLDGTVASTFYGFGDSSSNEDIWKGAAGTIVGPWHMNFGPSGYSLPTNTALQVKNEGPTSITMRGGVVYYKSNGT